MTLFLPLVGLFIAITSALIGLLVLIKNAKSQVHRILATLCFFVASYGLFYMLLQLTDDKELAHLMHIIVSIFYINVPNLHVHFTAVWLGFYDRIKKLLLTSYAIAAFFILMVPTKYFTVDMVPKFDIKYWNEPGPLYKYCMLYMLFVIGYFIYLLIRNYKISFGIKRTQLKFVTIGAVLGYVGAFSNLFYFYNINIPPYAMVLVVAWPIFITYAIIAHRLLDIKFVLRRSSVYLFSLITILAIVLPAKFFFYWKFTGTAIADSLNSTLLIDLVILILALAIFQPIKKGYYHLANKYFFSSLYDSQQIISDLNQKLRSTLDINKTYVFVKGVLVDSMHIKKVDFFMYQKDTNKYIMQNNGGVGQSNPRELVLDNNLQKQYIAQGKILVVEEAKRDNYQTSQQAIDALRQAGIEILVPLGTKNRIVGLIALGIKESSDPYNNEDIRVLGIVSGLSASAIENANLYTETRDKNIKLKELLEMKTDFLRVVNHQLNTPISIIRNALGAVKDGTLPLERSLEIANKGLERINSTLSDFWSAMELEGEREKSNLIKTNIEKIVYEIVDEKEEMELVKTKGLKLKLNKPEYDLPFVICDAKKITYAISNLIDNAIFYTKQGEINITFEKIEDNEVEYLKIYVSDTGSGIKPTDRKNLFKKFARGSGASKLHPDGSGLGLYISKKIVEDSHGQLKLENTVPDVGTTFSITLPIQK